MARRRSWATKSSNMANAYVIGIQFPIAILIGYFFGRWLDGWLGTWPWLTVVFGIFGIAAGFVNLIRMTAELTPSENSETQDDADGNSSNPDS